MAKVFDDLSAAQAGIEGEFSREVADELFDFGGLLPAIQTTDGGATTVGMEQAHEGTHGGGFARAVRAEEAEDFAFLDVEGDVDDATAFAVAFGEAVGLDDCRHWRFLALLMFIQCMMLSSCGMYMCIFFR